MERMHKHWWYRTADYRKSLPASDPVCCVHRSWSGPAGELRGSPLQVPCASNFKFKHFVIFHSPGYLLIHTNVSIYSAVECSFLQNFNFKATGSWCRWRRQSCYGSNQDRSQTSIQFNEPSIWLPCEPGVHFFIMHHDNAVSCATGRHQKRIHTRQLS